MSGKRILIPSYVEGFQCIGGNCEDSCCIGWDIDVDKKTFKKYARIKDPGLKPRIKDHVYRNRQSYSREVDFGRIAIKENRWCPFLNKEKLCDIHSALGEDYLSNVCYSFPRAYNLLDGVYELSLYMSCPEAVRKLLASRDPLTFSEREMIPVKHMLNSTFNSGDRYWKNSLTGRLPELRALSMEIVQDRTISLKERILMLGFRLDKISRGNPATDGLFGPRGKTDEAPVSLMEFCNYLIESLGIIDEIDSPVFYRYSEPVRRLFSSDASQLYEITVETVVKPFEKDHEYLFEHYLVNAIYQENFPFGESGDPFEAYLFLILRYCLIRYYVTGIAADSGKVEIDDVALMIQVQSKIINHHKSFKYNVLQELKRKHYDNMEFVSMILQ